MYTSANAGTHNHRVLSWHERWDGFLSNNQDHAVWVPAFVRRDDEGESLRGFIQRKSARYATQIQIVTKPAARCKTTANHDSQRFSTRCACPLPRRQL